MEIKLEAIRLAIQFLGDLRDVRMLIAVASQIEAYLKDR